MLEHGTVYLKYSAAINPNSPTPLDKYKFNKYSKYNSVYFPAGGIKEVYVTTNLRVLQEEDWMNDLVHLCAPTCFHNRRYTVRIVCDRAVSHELVRHRVFSFAQESQRYCNYSKDKFGKELTFISPAKDMKPEEYKVWRQALSTAEESYFKLIDLGFKPQEARSVLPNSTKTELIMTGFETDWSDFFDLRVRELTGPVSPDMKVVANSIYSLISEERAKEYDKHKDEFYGPTGENTETQGDN
jgi:thymidylate synthase (FAD)